MVLKHLQSNSAFWAKNQIETDSKTIISCIYSDIYREAEKRISLEKKYTESKSKPDFQTAGT